MRMRHFAFPLVITTTILLLSLLLSALASPSADDFVYDSTGHPLVAGGKYYIIPFNHDPNGGGLTWHETRKAFSICPELNVIQSNDFTKAGQPTTFSPINTKQTKIKLSTKVNVAFPKVSPPKGLPFFCHDSTNIWRMEKLRVELGGEKGENSDTVFAIEEHKQGGYVIKYCPKNYKKLGCGGLGVATKDGQRKLVANSRNPLVVSFSTEPPFGHNHHAKLLFGK